MIISFWRGIFLIAVMVASDAEIKCLEKRITQTDRSVHSGVLFVEGRFCQKDILLVRSGIGPRKARSAARQVVKRYSPSVIISIGAAGALDPRMKTGECVLVVETIQVSKDMQNAGKKMICDESVSNPVFDELQGTSFKISKGRCLTVSRFVHSRKEKKDLFLKYRGQMVDMESAALAETFSVAKNVFVNLRIISDPADADTADMETFHAVRKKGKRQLWFYFLKNPKELFHGWCLKREMHRVSLRMVEVLEVLLKSDRFSRGGSL